MVHTTNEMVLMLATATGEQWPELLGVLFNLSQSADAGKRESAFRIFATTPGIIEKQHEDTVLAAFTKGFKDDDLSVCVMIDPTTIGLILESGANRGYGGLCVLLPLYKQESTTEILPSNTRDTWCLTPAQGFGRLGTSIKRLGCFDRTG